MPVSTLILLRHAKSDWSGTEADIDRPLNDRGRHQAPLVGKWLNHHLPVVDRAVVSPAVRAQTTWSLATEELAVHPPTVTDDRMYAASSMQLMAVVRGLPSDASTVVLIAHNPGIEDVVALRTGQLVQMNTSALAVITLDGGRGTVSEDAGRRTFFGRPPRSVGP